jgi:signal transduction histidine kinase
LSVSRSIVATHNGRLWAADNSPRGASFHFILPTKIEEHEMTPTRRSHDVRHL